MRLDQGLFKLDFNDHHAVLGLPIDADSKTVRKRYLQIARKLHPDSQSGTSAADSQKASEMLSRLVNPAYETLSQEKSGSEHQLVLRLQGQTLHQTQSPPAVDTEVARKLLKTRQLESDYHQAVKALSQQQYDHLDVIQQTIGELSELNLVYLYRTAGDSNSSQSSQTSQSTAKSGQSSPGAQSTGGSVSPSPRRRTRDTILEGYINRAKDFEQSKDYDRAILELREALKTYPNSAECHSYLSNLYLKAGQSTMAKIHAKRALDINPNDEKAKAIQVLIEKSGGAGNRNSNSSKAGGKNNSGGKGGGFFGLFGGKKK